MMDKLNELMQNEYEAMALMNMPMAKLFEEAIKIIRSKVTSEEFLKIEEMLTSGYIDAERFSFEQGFMRGIVVLKGGASNE